MENRVQFNRILLVMLLTTVVWNTYTAPKPEENTTGKIMYCSRRRLLNGSCTACDESRVIIRRRGPAQEKQTLYSHANYMENYMTVTQSPLGSWNGPPPILHWSFDTLTGLALMAGSEVTNYDPLVPGKVNKAVVTDSSLNQWVDLGVLSEACITVLDSCGLEGAAISLWVKKIHSCRDGDGILSSIKYSNSRKTGFMFFCYAGYIRNYLAVKRRRFWPDVPKTNGQWIHLVLNFIGPNAVEGIEAFKDGILCARHWSGYSSTYTNGDGRVVVGRRHVSRSQDYAHVEVDELVFFNKALLRWMLWSYTTCTSENGQFQQDSCPPRMYQLKILNFSNYFKLSTNASDFVKTN